MPHLYGHYFTSVSSKPLAICKGDLLAGAGAMAIGLWKFWLRPMRVWLVLWLNWIPSLLIVDLEVKCLELLFWLYTYTHFWPLGISSNCYRYPRNMELVRHTSGFAGISWDFFPFTSNVFWPVPEKCARTCFQKKHCQLSDSRAARMWVHVNCIATVSLYVKNML